jgi:hypothetical protein
VQDDHRPVGHREDGAEGRQQVAVAELPLNHVADDGRVLEQRLLRLFVLLQVRDTGVRERRGGGARRHIEKTIP